MDYYIANLEVHALKGSEMKEELPDVRGGFVYIVIQAKNFTDAFHLILKCLNVDRYELIAIEYFSLFSHFEPEDEDEVVFKELFEKAKTTDKLVYGEFYCYPNEE